MNGLTTAERVAIAKFLFVTTSFSVSLATCFIIASIRLSP